MNPNFLKPFRTPETPGSFFLSFEGIEGSGKTTQIADLETHLKSLNKRVLVLREPGGSAFGEKLRQAILESQVPLHPLAECHLFLSSRAQLLNEKILPFLLQPDSVVILDRYIDSTIAYQGFARGLGLETILTLHQHNPLNLLPHRTYFLDIDFQTSLERQKQRGNAKDYFESEKEEFYQKLIAGYRALPELFPDRILKIDASGNPATIKTQIMNDLKTYLK